MGLMFKNDKVDFRAARGDLLDMRSGQARTRLIEKVVEHTIAAGATSTITAILPDGCIVQGYVMEVIDPIVSGGDRTTVNFGESGSGQQFGTKALATLVLAAGTKITFKDGVSPVGGKNYAAAQDLVIWLSGGTTGNLVSGKLRLHLIYLLSD